MFVRDLPECARNYLTDAYAKVRHYAGKADEIMQKAAVGYQMATPLVAAAPDAYATPAQKQTFKPPKKIGVPLYWSSSSSVRGRYRGTIRASWPMRLNSVTKALSRKQFPQYMPPAPGVI